MRTDNAATGFQVERVTAANGLRVAGDDLAMMVHLTQSTLRILPIGGHDADVVDALAAARFDVEAEAGHHHSLPVLRIRPSRLCRPLVTGSGAYRLGLRC